MRAGTKVLAVAGTTLAFALGSIVAAGAGPRHDAVAPVRHSTRVFHRVDAAVHAGYSQLTDVDGVTCIDGPPDEGNMGIHYVNGDLVGDGVVDAEHPEAVLYEQTRHGLRLTAVEYVVIAADWEGAQPPELFGHQFMLMEAPNRYGLPPFYALHAWLWKDNPSGRFSPWNPKVKCPAAH